MDYEGVIIEDEVLPQQPDWQIEDRYFGAGRWASYRQSGERIQIEDDLSLKFVKEEGANGMFNANTNKDVAEFILAHEDCSFRTIVSTLIDEDGKLHPPQVWLGGWRDASEKECDDFYDYEN